MNRALTAAVAGLLMLGCSACSPSSTTGGTSGASGVPTSAMSGAARDLTNVKCTADEASGEWTFTGKLTNTSQHASNYRVRVTLVRKEGSTVLMSKTILQKLAPGQSVNLKAEKFAKPMEKPGTLVCMPTTSVSRD